MCIRDREHEQDFICKATEYGDMEARKALAQQQQELSKAQARMTELDTLFRKLYEANALGRLTDERFVFLTSGYEDEKKSLAARIDELQPVSYTHLDVYKRQERHRMF